MKQIVLGTAGHIDHGKTSLIRALTGIDTDRLKEEKERGITIELGFAHLALPSGVTLGIVDVPGHERFVKNMVAGATGIDLVALVIAADEGVMPQTREHLEICNLLEVKHGLVVLTKIDMVDDEWLELVREDVRAYLSGSFLAEAPMVEVSSVTGQGMETFKETLDAMVQQIPERDPGHIFRLPIDRVFTIRGFGTVATGTSISGHIRTGEEVTLYPEEMDAKVRGLQVHNEDVAEVRAGLRTAINLQGVEKVLIERGDVLAGKGSLRPTFMLDVSLNLLASSPRKLKNRAKVRFHAGTAEIIGTVILLDREEQEPGKRCYAQIRLEQPTAVLRQDHYVIRSYSPVRTIGGGAILNALPQKKKRFSEAVLREMQVLDTGSLAEVLELLVAEGRFQGREAGLLHFLANTGQKRVDEALKTLLAQKRLVQYDRERGLLIQQDFYRQAREEILGRLTRFHQDFPLKAGLPKEELRTRTAGARNPRLFQFLMQQLVGEEELALDKELVRLKTHRVTLAEDQEAARRKLEAVYRKGGLEPPYFREIKDDFGGKAADDLLQILAKEGALVKVKDDLYFHRQGMDDLERQLVDFLRANGEITTQQFKDMAGVSRKYVIPLAEYFDRTGVTMRVGDNRILRKK